MLEQLIAPVTGLLDKFIPDADQKAKLAHEIATMSEKQHQEIMLQQIELAKIEAQGSFFTAFVAAYDRALLLDWMAYNVIVSPFLGIWLPVPEIQSDLLYPVLLGMLGMSGIRGYEKVKGKA